MVVHTRTLESADDVISVRYSYSNEKRLVIVSTLDCLIKVFFDDTLKFFLSLYGHTLPALALDASDDDTILASGGADKSIKIWGLDFGDTHRTLYGHTDSITDLKFVRKTHNFFTSSKDGTVRYWDGDRFEQILLLNGHISEVNCLAVAKSGAFVLSGAMDRQIRVWERTRDMVFLEEEKERALEDMFDKVDNKVDEAGTERIMRRRREDDANEEEDDENEPQSAEAVRKSVLSVAAGDRIMEAIERADQELKDTMTFRRGQEAKGVEARKRAPNPLLLGMEPSRYILWILRSIKCAELEQSLLVLPLNYMERLIFYLIVLLRDGHGIEICSRAAVFLVKSHQHQLIGHEKMSTPLRELRRLIKLRLSEARDIVGYNLAAIRMIQKLSDEHKNRYHVPDQDSPKDVFKGLGLGSELAEILQRKK
jgi:U3 small nucleolar RNA-associated protein 12